MRRDEIEGMKGSHEQSTGLWRVKFEDNDDEKSKQQSTIMALNTKSTHYYKKEQFLTLSHSSTKT